MIETQSIAKPWGASVFGAASVSASPDLARLRVAVKQTRPKPAEAFDVTRRAVNQVRQALRAHDIPDTAVSASRLDLKSSWDFSGRERTFRGYECTVSFAIELRELDILEAVLVATVDAGANHVDGVEFDVTTKKQLRAEARETAVAAAREKAELYARTSGVRLGPVIHIQDVDPDRLRDPYRGHGSGTSGGSDGDLAPGKITVDAAVILGFSLTVD